MTTRMHFTSFVSAPIPLLGKLRRASLCRSRVWMAATEEQSGAAAAAFGRDLRELLCGELGGTGRRILATDLAKRAGGAGDDFLRSRGLGGLADVSRQLREDVVPDLLARGPTYLADAARGFDAEKTARELGTALRHVPEAANAPVLDVPCEQLAARSGYDVRRYGTLVVAQVSVDVAGEGEGARAAALGKAFRPLASFLGGENAEGKTLSMTTPVMLDAAVERTGEEAAGETMTFILSEYVSVSEVPQPSGDVADVVTLAELQPAVYAVVQFGGFATAGEIARQQTRLKEALERDGVQAVEGTAPLCAVYDGPAAVPVLRRNELLLPVGENWEPEGGAEVDVSASPVPQT